MLYNNALGMIIISCAGSIPGYWASVVVIDTVGRKPLQVLGFLLLAVVFALLGFLYHSLAERVLLALYIIIHFLFNMGPNTTTFVVPGECFPTRYRSTGHGLSAAMGKIGAIIVQVVSVPLLAKDAPATCKRDTGCSPWVHKVMQIFALLMFLGFLVSFLIPETKGYTLEELVGEPSTSYNAGRNNSIDRTPSLPPETGTFGRVVRKVNPFGAGRPAGFIYPRSSGNRPGITRVGITSSPPLSGGELKIKRKGRIRAAFLGNSMWSRADSWHITQEMTAHTPQAGGWDPGSGQVPGWVAGWGRIDRGPTPMDGIRLEDVGSLLK